MLRGVAYVGVAPLQNGPAVDCCFCPFLYFSSLFFSLLLLSRVWLRTSCCLVHSSLGQNLTFSFSFTLFLWYRTLSFGSGKINQNLSDLFCLPLGPCFSRGGCISGCLDRFSVFKLIVNHTLVRRACLCSCCQSDSQSVHQSLIHVWSFWSALSVLVSCLLWLVVR